MSLAVEVAGFGLCQTASPYSILVICVQQETFQAWTVYRRYSSFVSLAEQLQILHPSIPNVPMFNPDNLSMDNLDHCRSAMDNWYVSSTSCNFFLFFYFFRYQSLHPSPLITNISCRLQSISSNPLILRTQSMYQFLCVDANMPPPYLEIHWRNR
jgi:PX domain